MNKKFFTLAASLMLASAFTANAQKVGQFVQLTNSNGVVSINTDGSLLATGGTSPSATNIATVNKELWKVAKATKNATTGVVTYQFVNKETGEYLAVNLKTHATVKSTTTVSTSAAAAKLDQTGNKEWVLNSGRLYAYSSEADSTYSFTNDMKLVAEKGNELDKAIVGTFSAKDLLVAGNELTLVLNAAGFNDLMKRPGHDGMLHFNNSKDVSSTETNVLKDTKWEAVDGEKVIYLKNGNKVDGYSYDGAAYTAVKNRNQYLQIDTTYQDKAGKKYFTLAVDTLGQEPGEEHKKDIDTHPRALAEFVATYFFGNDSIALVAKNKPVVATLTEGDYEEATYTTDKAAMDTKFSAAIAAVKAKQSTLIAAVTAMKTNANSWMNDYASDGSFTNSADYSSLKTNIDKAKYVENTALDAWAGFTGLSVTRSAYNSIVVAMNTYENTEGVTPSENYEKLKTALATWKAAIENNATVPFNTAIGLAYFSNDYKEVYASSSGGQTAQIGTLTDAMTSGDIVAEGNIATLFSSLDATNADGLKNAFAGTVGDFDTYTKEEELAASILNLKNQATIWYAAFPLSDKAKPVSFANTCFDEANTVVESGSEEDKPDTNLETTVAINELTELTGALTRLSLNPAHGNADVYADYFFDGKKIGTVPADAPVVLRSLADVKVLTINVDGQDGYIEPMIQPYATSGGDAEVVTDAKIYMLQVKNADKDVALKATNQTDKYLVSVSATKSEVAEADASNVYAQWAFIPGASGSYQIINRATKQVLYSGPVFNLKDATGNAVANTYVLGSDTLKLASVAINTENVYTESKKQYDYTGTYYAGPANGATQSFTIAPASQYLTTLAMQFNKDSLMVLGVADEAPVWSLTQVKNEAYGLEIAGLPRLKRVTYKISTADVDGGVYYVVADNTNRKYNLSKSTTNGCTPAEFEIREVADGKYLFYQVNAGTTAPAYKMTINASPAQPVLEQSALTEENDDYFVLTSATVNWYRKLEAEDGVLGNAKIYMENEPNRYLYENTANIVANNGTGYNFLGIYNSAELTKNAALFIDTAYVERKDNYMPQYMIGLGVETVEAHEAIPCTESGAHIDKDGNKTDAAHCVHATPATQGYKQGRYLVTLGDSVPENLSTNHPVYYDKQLRLAFVDAIHYFDMDTIVIKDSKFTGTKNAANDTLKIADKTLNPATFALRYADTDAKSFYLETKGGKYVRILNGVPVLTGATTDAAVFNIKATDEEATANEAIAAEGVQVIAGKGTVTVQGAAGKVITVANILGQTIANQVAASDNVTIAVPAGIVVVAVEGEATKVVVK